MNKRIVIIFLSLILATNVYALRVARPLILKHPLTEDQVSQLNRFLEDIWNMQYGRFEIDVVTSPKTNAKNGEFWMLETGSAVRVQFKAQDSIWTLVPEGL